MTLARELDPVVPDAPTERPVETVLQEIADDARVAPARYLEDTRVPEGGE